jgi:hypothetical protein
MIQHYYLLVSKAYWAYLIVTYANYYVASTLIRR